MSTSKRKAPTPNAEAPNAGATAPTEQQDNLPVGSNSAAVPTEPVEPAGPVVPAETLEQQEPFPPGANNAAEPSEPVAFTEPTADEIEKVDVPADLEVDALWITSVPESFRRCGFTFNREGYAVALEALTDEQIQQLVDEPNLRVEFCAFFNKAREGV